MVIEHMLRALAAKKIEKLTIENTASRQLETAYNGTIVNK